MSNFYWCNDSLKNELNQALLPCAVWTLRTPEDRKGQQLVTFQSHLSYGR